MRAPVPELAFEYRSLMHVCFFASARARCFSTSPRSPIHLLLLMQRSAALILAALFLGAALPWRKAAVSMQWFSSVRNRQSDVVQAVCYKRVHRTAGCLIPIVLAQGSEACIRVVCSSSVRHMQRCSPSCVLHSCASGRCLSFLACSPKKPEAGNGDVFCLPVRHRQSDVAQVVCCEHVLLTAGCFNLSVHTQATGSR